MNKKCSTSLLIKQTLQKLKRLARSLKVQNEHINELDEHLKTLQDFINEPDNKDKPVVIEMTLKSRR